MIDVNGLLQTLDNKFISRQNLLALYTFAESGSIINHAANYSGTFNGILSGPNTFYYASGVGYPTTNVVSISGTGFYSSDFSHLFVVQKAGQDNDNYFSSISAESGSINSGYSISTTSLGNITFGYRDCTGPKNLTSSFILNNTSSFAVIKNGNTVSFFQYTPITNSLDRDSFQVNGNEIFESDYADLFYANHAPAGFIKNYYSGFINNYIYFNIGLSPNQVIDVFSGLFTSLVYNSGNGSNNFDECTGVFTSFSPTTIVTSGNIPNSSVLTKQGVVLLRPFPSGSTIIVDYDSGNSTISWNKQANFDFNLGYFVLNATSIIPPIVYLNGQRVLSGIAQLTGQFCATGMAWERDYQFTGNRQINPATNYNLPDTVIYDVDVPNINKWQQLFSGSGSVNINTGSGFAVYLNGQRILDYLTSGSNISLSSSISLTDIINIDYYKNGFSVLGEVYTTGFFYTSGSFIKNTSRVYLNGIRMLLNQDYLEITSGSLLQNAPLDVPQNIVVDITGYNLWNL